jgi:hypothetical protein
MKNNELTSVLIAIIVLAFSFTMFKFSLDNFIYYLLFIAIIFIVNIIAKKLTAFYVQSGVETRIWHFQRYGFKEKEYLKKPFPIGVVLPILISFASLGSFVWMAATQSEIRALKSRVAKKHDFYSYSEMTEWHIAVIPALGIIACLVLAFLAYLMHFPTLGKLAIFFSVFNMIPLGELDGTKIFYGSVVLWFILAAISLIALGYALLLI